MKILLFLIFVHCATATVASATSYSFTLENSFAQSALIAEVRVTASKVYPSDFCNIEEVEVECEILKLYKGPANLKSFRVRYYSSLRPTSAKALVFAFRPSGLNEIRAFNGSGGIVGERDDRFSFGFEKLKVELARVRTSGTAKPAQGFSEGTLDGPNPLEPGTLTFFTNKE